MNLAGGLFTSFKDAAYIRHASWLVPAGFAGAGAGYLAQFILARSLGPVEFGGFAAVIGLVSLVTLPMLGVQMAVAARVRNGRLDDAGISSAFGSHLTLTIVLGLTTTLAAFVVLPLMGLHWIGWPLLTGLTAACIALPSFSMGVLLGTQSTRRAALLSILNKLVLLVLAVAILLVGAGPAAAVAAFAAGAVAMAALAARSHPLSLPAFHWRALHFIPWRTILVLLLLIALAQADILFVKHHAAPEAAGQFAMMKTFGLLVFFLAEALGQAFVPARGESKGTTTTSTIIFVVLSGAAATALLLAGPTLIPLLLGEAYAEASQWAWIYVLAMVPVGLAAIGVYHRIVEHEETQALLPLGFGAAVFGVLSMLAHGHLPAQITATALGGGVTWGLLQIKRDRAAAAAASSWSFSDRFRNWVQKWHGLALTLTFMLAYIVGIGWWVVARHQAFLSSAYDLGIMNQAIYTTAIHGRLFYETPDLIFNPAGSFFGVHFSPTLLLLVPLYWFHPGPETLVVAQTVVIALGALPAYALARHLQFSRLVSSQWALVYLAQPGLILMNLNDYHVQSFVPPLVMGLAYAYAARHTTLALLSGVLLVGTIEFSPFLLLAFSFASIALGFGIRVRGWRILRVYVDRWAVTMGAVLGALALMCIPLSMAAKRYFNPFTSPFSSTFNSLGDSLPEALGTVLTEPGLIIALILTNFPQKAWYVLVFSGPLLFLPFLSGRYLAMAGAWFAAAFLSGHQAYFSPFFQYNAFVVGAFVAGAILAGRAIASSESGSRRLVTAVLFATAMFILILGPWGEPADATWNHVVPEQDERARQLAYAVSHIPPEASVLAPNHIFPHVSSRIHAYIYPNPHSAEPFRPEYVIMDPQSEWHQWSPLGRDRSYADGVGAVFDSGEYSLFLKEGPVEVWKLHHEGRPISYSAQRWHFQDELRLESGEVSPEGHFIHDVHHKDDATFTFGPYLNVHGGSYNVTWIVRRGDAALVDEPVVEVEVYDHLNAKTLASRRLYVDDVGTDWTPYSLTFEVQGPAELEFRTLHARNITRLELQSVELREIPPGPVDAPFLTQSLRMTFGHNDLQLYTGAIVEDASSQANKVLAREPADPPGTLSYGPYVALQPGTYEVIYRMKVDAVPTTFEHLAVLDVYVDEVNDQMGLVERKVQIEDLPVGEWREIRLEFNLESPATAEFRVIDVPSGVGLRLDYIKLRTVTALDDVRGSQEMGGAT